VLTCIFTGPNNSTLLPREQNTLGGWRAIKELLLKDENSRLSHGGTKAMSMDEAMSTAVQNYWTLLRLRHFIHI